MRGSSIAENYPQPLTPTRKTLTARGSLSRPIAEDVRIGRCAPSPSSCSRANPSRGQTKTRLIPAIGSENAAALADAFNRDAIAKAKRLAPARLVIAGSAVGGATRSRYFKSLAREFGATLRDQGAGHLGTRMAAAMRPFLGAGGALLMGTDTPSLPMRLLAESADLFENYPALLAPSLNGGYYLVAARGALPGISRR